MEKRREELEQLLHLNSWNMNVWANYSTKLNSSRLSLLWFSSWLVSCLWRPERPTQQVRVNCAKVVVAQCLRATRQTRNPLIVQHRHQHQHQLRQVSSKTNPKAARYTFQFWFQRTFLNKPQTGNKLKTRPEQTFLLSLSLSTKLSWGTKWSFN